MSATELLTELLALTPAPPAADALPAEQLIAIFEAILEQRAEVIARLTAPISLSDGDRTIWHEIERRQRAWQDMLATVLEAIGAQRAGTKHLRSYAQHL